MPRPKRDSTDWSFSSPSVFWRPVLNRIGKRMIKAGYMTDAEWRDFSGDWGGWGTLKTIACQPDLLREGGGWGQVLCDHIIRRPMATLYFLAWIREEVASFSPLECWLFDATPGINFQRRFKALEHLRQLYPSGGAPLQERKRCNEAAPDKELAQLFTVATKMQCTVKEVERARANIRRRLKHSAAA